MAKIFGSFKQGTRVAFDPIGRALVRAGVSPDAVTLLGTAGVIFGAVAFAARGALVSATIIITLSGLLDVLDGAMARARGRATRYGALLDSTMDRVADGAIFACLAWWMGTTGQWALAAATLFCLVGGQVVSYIKARAEGLGFSCDVGVAERMERLTLVGVGALMTGFGLSWGLAGAMWLLVGLTLITAMQRLIHVRRLEARADSLAGESLSGVSDAAQHPHDQKGQSG